jgi:hypothetical protein
MARMRRVIIPDDILLHLESVNGTLLWIRRVEKYIEQLEQDLTEYRATLRYCFFPKLQQLQQKEMEERYGKRD